MHFTHHPKVTARRWTGRGGRVREKEEDVKVKKGNVGVTDFVNYSDANALSPYLLPSLHFFLI